MAKDILESVASYLAEKGANEEVINLIEEQSSKLLELSNSIKFNYLKTSSDQDVKLLIAGKDQQKKNNDLEERFNELYLDHTNLSISTMRYIADLTMNVAKLTKRVIRNRWEVNTEVATNNLGRLSDFKGPIQNLNKEDIGDNWVGLQNEPEWTSDRIEPNFFSNILNYTAAAEPVSNRYGEKARRWIYMVDHGYNTANADTDVRAYENPEHAYSNNAADTYQSEMRFKGLNVIGLSETTDDCSITLGGIDGFDTINADGDFEVYQELRIAGNGIESDEIGLNCSPNAGFSSNVSVAKQLLFSTSGNDISGNEITSSIIANKDIESLADLVGQGLKITPTGGSNSDQRIIFDHSLDFTADGSNSIRFGSSSSGIYFGPESDTNPAFYKNGSLWANVELKTRRIYTNSFSLFSTSGIFDDTSSRTFYISDSGNTVIGGTIKQVTSSGDNNIYFSSVSSTFYLPLKSESTFRCEGTATFIENVEMSQELSCSGGIDVGGSIDIGITDRNTITCNNFDGVAASAKYADIAENYKILKDDIIKLVPGTVVSMSDAENDAEIVPYDSNLPLAGIISSAPGYLLNKKEKDDDEYDLFVPVALTGRVPAKTKDNIKKGMYILPSKNSSGYVTGYSKKELCGLSTIDKLEIIGIAISNSVEGIVEIKM